MLRKTLIFVLCICVISITGCGNSVTSDDKSLTENKVKENQDLDNNVKTENDNNNNVDKPATEDKITNADKYVNADDKNTFFILNDDNTFNAKVNYCSGYYETGGTYELKYSNTLTGYEPKTLILSFKDNKKEILKITKYNNGKIKNLTADNHAENNDMVLSACSGYDFYLSEE